MTCLKSNLYDSFNSLNIFLEKYPAGSTYDTLKLKIPSLRLLNKEDFDLLFKYVVERGFISVTKNEAGEITFLKHKRYMLSTNELIAPSFFFR